MDWHARPYEWVGDWSARRASLTPDREAIVDATTGERYSYAAIDARANRTARLLVEYGVEQSAGNDGGDADECGDDDSGNADAGERVAVVSRNRVEVFDLFFATGKTGGVLAPLSHRLAPPELGELLELVDPRLLVVEEPFAERVADALDSAAVDPPVLGLPDDTTGDGEDADGGVSADGSEFGPLDATAYHDELPSDDSPIDTARAALDDPHLLLHTGGSTGTPKETVVTHGSIVWNSFNTIASWGLRPDDVTPMVFPTFHTGGWNVISLPLFHVGGTILIDREVDPERVLEQIERESATLLVAVPAVLRMMAGHEDWTETDLSSLRFVKSGGGPCRESVIRAWRERDGQVAADDGVDLSQGYGLTECGPNNFAMPDGWGDGPEDRTASVGKPAMHVDARVVDDLGEPLPDGEIGELELAGPHAAGGYWRNPEETEAAFGAAADTAGGDEEETERWVSTGDLARIDDDGYVYIEGRKKNMFVSGGENVYPPAIEDAIAEHEAVGDAVVIGIPDEQWGTVGKAVVEPAGGVGEEPLDLDELQDFLEGRLASYEIPQSLAFVAALPTSGPSKIDRQAVRERFGE